MNKAFATVNIHTSHNKLVYYNIPNTTTKYIANQIKERKAYTPFKNKICTQH